MARKTGLGRGLDALIPSMERSTTEGVALIALDEIKPNPRQPRSHFDPEVVDAFLRLEAEFDRIREERLRQEAKPLPAAGAYRPGGKFTPAAP